ncbi:MAG: SDR family oxidoreductase [Acidimicrobiia bacterium]|nr:SDR family oxidoreductase [Acidimicrobiia bacterium]
MKRYDGEVAVVTGASSGLGRRLALELASRGATVVGIARRKQLLDDLAADLQGRTSSSRTVACDVGDTDAYRDALAQIESDHGKLDILIAAAATEAETRVPGATLEDFRSTMDVNFFGVVAGTLAVVPGMVARRHGVVVNVSSDSARAPAPGGAAYAASKAAVSAFSEAVAMNVVDNGVRVHVLYPGWVPTPMGLAAVERGMPLPPKPVRRTEDEIAELVCERMGSDAIELNASRLPVMAPLARAFFPKAYRRSVTKNSDVS